ncbi:MAG: choice-of-anchor B family protein [Rhodothermales bacterium]
MNTSGGVVALFGLTLLFTPNARAQSHDVVSQAGFGTAVAADGSELFVGEPLNKRFSGRVYVYRKDGASGDWANMQVLEPTDGEPMNGFGAAIAASADLAAIVSIGEKTDAIHVFRRGMDSQWIEEAVLHPDKGMPDEEIGADVAVAGGRVFATISGGESAVRFVVFERSNSGDDWVEAANVELPAIAGTDLPRPIAATDDVAFVGGPSMEGGAVFELKNGKNGWNVTRILQDVSGDMGDTSLFGAALALDGGNVLVGAPETDDGRGAVYVFSPGQGGNFNLSQTLTIFGDSTAPYFGSVVAAYGGSVLVGAYDPDKETGIAFAFATTEAARYEPVQTIGSTAMEDKAEFATALALGDGFAVVGAMADLFGYGSVFTYEGRPSRHDWVLTSQLKSKLTYHPKSITGGKVKCEDGEAAEFPCHGVDMMSFVSNEDMGLPWGYQTNDIWGWTDPETGKEYAIVCTMGGTTFVDVSDPSNPVVLGELPMTPGTRPNWWRDAKTYKNYAYIVADNVGNHGLQILDLTQLRDVENPPVKFKPTAHYDGFGSAHNIIIDEATGFAYVVGINGGGSTCSGGSHILDLKEPTKPKFVGCFAHPGTGETSMGYTHDAQCVVYHGPDERYTGHEICIGANETAISIADFTDKSNIVPIAVGRYPNVSYAHQGWLSEDHRYYFQDDETDEINGFTAGTRTLVWDLAELDDPVLIDEHVSSDQASDHNLYVKGSYMYQSNYLAGLRVLDVSNPEQIDEVGYFDTVPWGEDRPGYGGSWSNYPFFKSGTIVVGSLEEGVFFLKRSEVAP